MPWWMVKRLKAQWKKRNRQRVNIMMQSPMGILHIWWKKVQRRERKGGRHWEDMLQDPFFRVFSFFFCFFSFLELLLWFFLFLFIFILFLVSEKCNEFRVNVGNLPPKEQVLIVLVYVAEVEFDIATKMVLFSKK